MPARGAQEQLDSIAANVRAARTRAGLTQEALAEKMRVPARYLQKVERAELNITVSTLVRLAAALEVDTVELVRQAKLQPSRPGRPPNPSRRR